MYDYVSIYIFMIYEMAWIHTIMFNMYRPMQIFKQ